MSGVTLTGWLERRWIECARTLKATSSRGSNPMNTRMGGMLLLGAGRRLGRLALDLLQVDRLDQLLHLLRMHLHGRRIVDLLHEGLDALLAELLLLHLHELVLHV